MEQQQQQQEQENQKILKTDEYGFEIYDEEIDEEIDEETSKEKTSEEEKKPSVETLSPFALIVKNYLENEIQKDEDLAKTVDKSVHAYNLCASWIEEKAKESVKDKRGYQIGFLSDDECYTMMKEFFADGVYVLKIEEEKEKEKNRLEAEKKQHEKEEKEKEKKRLEEEKKRKEEEDKKRWEEFLKKPSETEKKMNDIDLETLKNKFSKQGEFEF